MRTTPLTLAKTTLVVLARSVEETRFRFPGAILWAEIVSMAKPKTVLDRTAVADLPTSFNEAHYDLAFCFRTDSFLALEELKDKCPRFSYGSLFVDMDDIESVRLSREIKYQRTVLGFEQTAVAYLRMHRYWMWEARILKRADAVSVCSSVDQKRLLNRTAAARIAEIPNCAPAISPQPASGRRANQANLLFVGTLSYAPNEDGILYFCNEILPLIRGRVREIDIRLSIVGRRPSSAILNLSACGIDVVGEVDDVGPYYHASDVVIAPIRFGSGTRIKILEALAYERPVVTTTLGCEGLALAHGEDILIADTPRDFADYCVSLLTDEPLRRSLALNGGNHVRRLYSRERIQRVLADAVSSILPSAGRTPQQVW